MKNSWKRVVEWRFLTSFKVQLIKQSCPRSVREALVSQNPGSCKICLHLEQDLTVQKAQLMFIGFVCTVLSESWTMYSAAICCLPCAHYRFLVIISTLIFMITVTYSHCKSDGWMFNSCTWRGRILMAQKCLVPS